MTVDLQAWRAVLEGVVDSIADEEMQRRSWFGIGPEVWSPDEAFCQFFGDADAEEFLAREDTGLDPEQLAAGRHLLELMRKLSDQTPEHINPDQLIDDPRWQEIRKSAAYFHNLLLAR
jgi:hypothetical protein